MENHDLLTGSCLKIYMKIAKNNFFWVWKQLFYAICIFYKKNFIFTDPFHEIYKSYIMKV